MEATMRDSCRPRGEVARRGDGKGQIPGRPRELILWAAVLLASMRAGPDRTRVFMHKTTSRVLNSTFTLRPVIRSPTAMRGEDRYGEGHSSIASPHGLDVRIHVDDRSRSLAERPLCSGEPLERRNGRGLEGARRVAICGNGKETTHRRRRGTEVRAGGQASRG